MNFGNILCWEGIVIDLIGVLFVVIVYEYIIFFQGVMLYILYVFSKIIGIGLFSGLIVGYFLGVILCNYWVLYYLCNIVVLIIILGVFVGFNFFVYEFGLLIVIIVGIMLVNMCDVDVDDILEFKEILSVLLIFGLFILLVICLDFGVVVEVGWVVVIVLILIIFVVCFLLVFIFFFGIGFNWCELVLLSWVVFCGIVVVVVFVLFLLKLEVFGYVGVEVIVFFVFLVIIIMVVLQGLIVKFVVRLLGVCVFVFNGFLLFGVS